MQKAMCTCKALTIDQHAHASACKRKQAHACDPKNDDAGQSSGARISMQVPAQTHTCDPKNDDAGQSSGKPFAATVTVTLTGT